MHKILNPKLPKGQNIQINEDLPARLRKIESRWDIIAKKQLPCENPVFILSAGWRTGSTLLQRMLVADGQIMIWGEPFAHSGIIQKMADQFRAFTNQWPNSNHLKEELSEIDSDSWIANISPSVNQLRDSHRLFFDHLFGEPARRNNKKLWGIKEVRWNSQHASYLKWLFPEARFLWLVRNPFDAWSSYKQRGPWFFEWPDKPISSVSDFAAIWDKLTRDFYSNYNKIGGILLKYEDLESNTGQMSEYLNRPVKPPKNLTIQKGHAITHGTAELSVYERSVIRIKTRKTRKLFDYE